MGAKNGRHQETMENDCSVSILDTVDFGTSRERIGLFLVQL